MEGHDVVTAVVPPEMGGQRAYVVVVGNEKGGSGKSTTAIHLIVALLRLGYRVGSLDLDARQGTLTRYLENRGRTAEIGGQALQQPAHRALERPADAAAARASLYSAFRELAGCQVLVVDTPGSDTLLCRLAHGSADTLITPINDSFLDIDVLARIDVERREALAPSVYTRLVWEQNNRRVAGGLPPLDWVVLRNRLTHIDARNKREIASLLGLLARRIGFRVAPGLGERVVYRELFDRGLTVLDLPADGGEGEHSHRAARDELDGLLRTMGLVRSAAA